jgi:hypothetical protein
VIIRPQDDRLLFITQTDHAALAADVMARWQPGGLSAHPRRDAILTAARMHDDGWREEDAETHVGRQGEPLDFIAVPAYVKQRIWPRAVERLSAASPYVGALVAQHSLTVHATHRGAPEWAAFFAAMEHERDALLSACTADQAASLSADYPFVRIGDQLSLIFCNAWREPLSGPGYRAILDGSTLQIMPDPFAGARVRLAVPARVLPQRSYASSADLREELARAPLSTIEGEAAGA